MKVEDNINIYEISKHLTKNTQNASEQVGDQSSANQQQVAGVEQSGQDTIVNLSPALKEAQAVKNIIESEPDIRTEKVAAIKAKIESGQYRIDHQAVADRLVDTFIDEMS